MRRLLCTTLLFSAGLAHAEVPRVATDIAPIHSLVSMVMQGAGSPDLIIPPGASPHSYAMRPSEARAVAKADLVVWVGPELSPWLGRVLEALELPGPLEDMSLTLSGITGESGLQSSLFSDLRKQDQLKEMMRQLEALLGCRPPIYRVRDVEPWSRIPERRQALVPFDP